MDLAKSTSRLLAVIENLPVQYENTLWRVEKEQTVVAQVSPHGVTSGKFYYQVVKKDEILIVKNSKLYYKMGVSFLPVFLKPEGTFLPVIESWIPVPFMEAAQAFKEGKQVKALNPKNSEEEKFYVDNNRCINEHFLIQAVDWCWFYWGIGVIKHE
jgi:hypothetical protein